MPTPSPAPASVRHTPQTILLTGAAGFIGSHVCEALLARGDRVIGVDNFDPYYDVRLKERNLREVRATDERLAASPGAPASRFHFVEADCADEASMRRVFREHTPTGVIHLAAKAGVRPSIADPFAYARANVLATTLLLEEARKAGCTRFVMASSSSVYGNNPKVPFSEDDDVSGPISPYAATKRACELIGHSHWSLTKMPTACLRFFTVFGPRQRPDLAIALFLKKISAGEEIPMFGDGSTSRDYTFIDDIVAGVVASYDRIDRHGFRIWNLGGSEPVTLRDMIDTIARVVATPAKIKQGPRQPGDVERTFADLARASAELGYKPSTRFEDGVRRQWAWMQSRRED